MIFTNSNRAPHVHFIQAYGMTETAPVVLWGWRGVGNYATVGKALSRTELKICKIDDPTFVGLGPNETGELLTRGPQNMKGYFNNEEATNAMVTSRGWLRTGDVAYYDDDGLFYITDRLKELIKVKGFQVAPAELEAIIRTHPDVLEVAVVGIQHRESGEVPRAFVVKRHEVVTEKDIVEFVAEKTADYKHLKGGVVFLDSIPKNASGKILRREVKRLYC